VSVLVLVVDDEPDVEALFRQQFRRDLRAERFIMDFASSAPDALARVGDTREHSLILILSDINMPGMDGLTLLGEIKRRWPELPVIMVTAYGDEERRRVASKCGASDFLAKPVDFDFLKQQLLHLPTASG
jgi:CheY-like chemotaxis protein